MSSYAGRLQDFVSVWKSITKNKIILSWVSGVKIPFLEHPKQNKIPREPKWSYRDDSDITLSIKELLSKQVITKVRPVKHQFISNIFLTPKPDGTRRLILNLKGLNKYIKNAHFKIEDQKTVAKIIRQFSFMTTVDLKDAYYLVSINNSHRKFLRFRFKGILYQFNCLPFGISCAPRIFTKIMKPVVKVLRERGFTSVLYLNYFSLLGNSYSECSKNTLATTNLLGDLGFIINYKKSALTPAQNVNIYVLSIIRWI